MNFRQLITAAVLSVVVLASVIGLMQASGHYLHGYRMKDRYGYIVHVVSMGRKNVWNDVLKNPVLALVGIVCIGCYYIYELRDRK